MYTNVRHILRYLPKNGFKMGQIAKLFMNGRSQAVRLPRDYRFSGSEVYIRRDPVTGDVIISEKPSSWDGFFELRDKTDVPDDFMNDRHDDPPQDRKLFE